MKGAVFAVLYVIAFTHGAVVVNENGCPIDFSIHKLLPHPDCGQFYQCVNGHLIEMHCAPGLHFSTATSTCDFQFAANCQPGNVENLDVNPNDNHLVSPSGDDNDIPEGAGHDDPSKANAICGADDSDGVLVAHENCNRFYKCAFGHPVAQICSGILLFDPSKDRCEWPNTVECGSRVIPEPSDETTTVWTPKGAGNDDPSQAGDLCAADGSDHSYVAHENCAMFYQCWAGLPVPLPCPPNTLFNPYVDYCDFPSNVECGSRTIPDNFGNDIPEDNNNEIVEEDVPVGANNDDPSQATAICSAADSEGVLVAHENCNRFYKCAHGLPVAQICPGILLFDPSKDRCEWPNTVECGSRVIPDPSDEVTTEWTPNGAGNDDPSQAGAICVAEGSDHSYVAHENCAMFYQCWAGLPVPLPCPPNTLFNPNVDYCDFPSNVECGSRTIPENFGNDVPEDINEIVEDDVPVGANNDDPSQATAICSAADAEGVLVAHENCNRFYKCAHGLPVAQICPGILLFDPTRDRCEWPNTVECGNRVIPEPSDEVSTEWTPNGAGNDDPSQAGAICAAEGSDHSYVAHENCDMFYQCWAGLPVPLPCPPNFYFNPTKDYCDFPSNVDCGNRIV